MTGREVVRLTEKVCDVEPWRAGVSDRLEVVLALVVRARVHNLTLGKQHAPVEQGDNVGPRLVDRKDDGAVVVPGERDERLDDVERVERVEA